MTRIEKPSPWLKEKTERDQIKDEIRHELKLEQGKKGLRKILTCCIIELLITLIIATLLAFSLAKSGLVEVPLFTKLFYSVPTPQKIVKVPPGSLFDIQSSIKEQAEKQIFAQIKEGKTDLKLEITLGENGLTTLLNQEIKKVKETSLGDPQISITKEKIEFFSEIYPEENREVYLTLGFRPVVKDGKLEIKIVETKIGTLPLPSFLANIFIKAALDGELEKINETIGAMAKIDKVELLDGEMKINLSKK